MAVSNVYGLERFREHMGGLAGCYAVIGGTACDILLSDADIAFRATKDIDVVLLIEERLPEVGRAVWDMVTDGGYTAGGDRRTPRTTTGSPSRPSRGTPR